jgi:hypothetical protein
MDLRLMDMAASRASQRPVLKAGTRWDNVLNCHEALASRAARTLVSARRLQIGHGADPRQRSRTVQKYRTVSFCFAMTILPQARKKPPRAGIIGL